MKPPVGCTKTTTKLFLASHHAARHSRRIPSNLRVSLAGIDVRTSASVLWSIIRTRAQTIRVSLKAKRLVNHVFAALSTIKASTPSSHHLPASTKSWVHGPRLESLDFLKHPLVAVLDEGILTYISHTTCIRSHGFLQPAPSRCSRPGNGPGHQRPSPCRPSPQRTILYGDPSHLWPVAEAYMARHPHHGRHGGSWPWCKFDRLTKKTRRRIAC